MKPRERWWAPAPRAAAAASAAWRGADACLPAAAHAGAPRPRTRACPPGGRSRRRLLVPRLHCACAQAVRQELQSLYSALAQGGRGVEPEDLK